LNVWLKTRYYHLAKVVPQNWTTVRYQWLMPVIPATQEAEIRRSMVWSQPGQIVRETLSWKNPSQKLGWWNGSRCRFSMMPHDWWMDQENVVFIHNGILCSHEEEQNLIIHW
jgi:hypothetical protein